MATFVIVALLYAPPVVVTGLGSGLDYATGSSLGALFDLAIPSLLGIWSDHARGMPQPLVAVLGIGFVLGVVSTRRQGMAGLLD